MGEAGEAQLDYPVLSMAFDTPTIVVRIGDKDQHFPRDTTLDAVQRFADECDEAIFWYYWPRPSSFPDGESDGSTQEHASNTFIPKAVEEADIPCADPPVVATKKRKAAAPKQNKIVQFVGFMHSDNPDRHVELSELGVRILLRNGDDIRPVAGCEDKQTESEKKKNTFHWEFECPKEILSPTVSFKLKFRSREAALAFLLYYSNDQQPMEGTLSAFLPHETVPTWTECVKTVQDAILKVKANANLIPYFKNASGDSQCFVWDEQTTNFVPVTISKRKRSPEQIAVLEKHSGIQREKKRKPHGAPAAERSLGSVVAGYTDDIPDLD